MQTQTDTDTNKTHKIIANGIKRELPCKLNDRELLDTALAKADLEAELSALEAEFGDVKDDWKQRIEDAEKRIEKLGGEIHDRARKAVVICHERIEIATRMIEVVREDTEEVVDRRVANLFEVGKVMPQAKHVAGDEVAAPGDEKSLDEAAEETERAASAQRANGVSENDEGDVVPPDVAAPKAKRKARK